MMGETCCCDRNQKGLSRALLLVACLIPVLLLLGSCLWAYIIGNVCGIVSTLDVEESEHQHTMDQLNAFMSDRRVPVPLKRELRLYFNMRQEIAKTENYQALLEVMSPDLKAKVTLVHSSWLYEVGCFRQCTERFIVAACDLLCHALLECRSSERAEAVRCTVAMGLHRIIHCGIPDEQTPTALVDASADSRLTS